MEEKEIDILIFQETFWIEEMDFNEDIIKENWVVKYKWYWINEVYFNKIKEWI